MEGVNGFIVANDIKGIGHFTEYPSDKETVALQAPFSGGVPPEHVVLERGACHSNAVEENEENEEEGDERRDVRQRPLWGI